MFSGPVSNIHNICLMRFGHDLHCERVGKFKRNVEVWAFRTAVDRIRLDLDHLWRWFVARSRRITDCTWRLDNIKVRICGEVGVVRHWRRIVWIDGGIVLVCNWFGRLERRNWLFWFVFIFIWSIGGGLFDSVFVLKAFLRLFIDNTINISLVVHFRDCVLGESRIFCGGWSPVIINVWNFLTFLGKRCILVMWGGLRRIFVRLWLGLGGLIVRVRQTWRISIFIWLINAWRYSYWRLVDLSRRNIDWLCGHNTLKPIRDRTLHRIL